MVVLSAYIVLVVTITWTVLLAFILGLGLQDNPAFAFFAYFE